MKQKQIFIYGAGGHAKVLADILIANRETNLVGFVDDRPELTGAKVLGLPVLGTGEWLRREAEKSRISVGLGVGDNYMRHRLAQLFVTWGIEVATLVHREATVSLSAQLGVGTVVMAGARVNPDATVGRGVIVNTGAVVEHDVIVGDYAHVAPNAAMAGASCLGSFSHLGLGSVVLQSVRIGSHTIIGAGGVVVRDIPSHAVAFGVPARIHRYTKTQEEPNADCLRGLACNT